jgi:hypothetical protein
VNLNSSISQTIKDILEDTQSHREMLTLKRKYEAELNAKLRSDRQLGGSKSRKLIKFNEKNLQSKGFQDYTEVFKH